jgi:hypothetical protein
VYFSLLARVPAAVLLRVHEPGHVLLLLLVFARLLVGVLLSVAVGSTNV